MDEKKLKAGIKCHSAESQNQVNGCDSCPYDENDPMLDPRIDPDYGKKVLEKCAKCRDELIDDCIEYIATLEKRIAIMSKGGWISINKKLPTEYARYWVYTTNGRIFSVEFNPDEKYKDEPFYQWGWKEPEAPEGWVSFYFDDGENDIDEITHWMYCIEPPKEGDTE